MLVENRDAVQRLKLTLEPMVIGKQKAGWSCSCGCLSAGPAFAAEVIPAGDSHPGQEMDWWL